MSLADAIDLCDIYEATGKTVNRAVYVDEIRIGIEDARQASMFEMI